jgi:DNA-directed RNA polymerase specialized sigma24 family protein
MDEREDQQIDPAVLRLARFKGRQLAGKYGFAGDDAEDIQQELLLDYLKRSLSFDAHRCNRRTFARLVFDHHAAALIEAQTAGCRDHRLCRISLDQVAGQHQSRGPEQVEWRVGKPCERRFSESRFNTKLDVERTLIRLPAVLASICRLLMVCDSAVEVAAKAGISRATLYRRVHQARNAFIEAGWADREARTPT